jgi:hypothetical protein
VPDVLAKETHRTDFQRFGYLRAGLPERFAAAGSRQYVSRTWRVDAKRLLKPTGNKLHIYFESPLKKTDESWKNLGYELPGGQRTLTRKAQFHYGWDWGPRFVGCGILQKPTLEAWDDLIFENVYITTQSVTPEKARMVARFRYRSDLKFPVNIAVQAKANANLWKTAYSGPAPTGFHNL